MLARAVLVVATSWLAAPDERGDFFRGTALIRLDIEVAPEAMDALRKEPRSHVRSNVKEDGRRTYKDVGLHLKGNASFRELDDKPGLTLSLDKFADGRKFHGMDKIHLNNSVQDPTFAMEAVTADLFRAAGVPAARVRHAVVTLNGRSLGVYCLKEGYDKAFLGEHFGNSNGNFYDGGFLRDVDQPLDRTSGKGDVADQADVKALVEAAREEDLDRRYRALERRLDLDRFVAMMAVDALSWNWDGYAMKPNNYRLYHDPRRDKITFIPSGMDQVFGDVTAPIQPDFGGLVARALIETPRGRERYAARLTDLVTRGNQADAMARRLEAIASAVAPALGPDEEAVNAYRGQVGGLQEAIRARIGHVADQLARSRPGEVMAPLLQEALGLTPAQRAAIEAAQKDVDATIARTLSPQQRALVAHARAGLGGGILAQIEAPNPAALGRSLAAPLMEAIDAHPDGRLSRDEWRAGVSRFFAESRREDAAALDGEALGAGLRRVLRRPAEGRPDVSDLESLLAKGILARCDADGDGSLTLDEMLAGASALFDEIDRDQAGALGPSAVASGIARLIPPPPEIPPQPGPP